MTREQLKKKILAKFGKYSKFTRAAGIDRTFFQKDFLRDNAKVDEIYLNQIAVLLDTIEPISERDALTPKQIKFLKKAIKEFGGITKLCAEKDESGEPMFSPDPIFKVLAGDKATQTPTAKKLLDFFGYQDDQ